MKKTIVFVVLLAIGLSEAKAQQQEKETQQSYITFSIFEPIFSFAPRYTFGYIQPINKRWMLGLETGYGAKSIAFGITEDTDRINDDYKSFSVTPQAYYMVHHEGARTKKFFMAEVQYINHQDTFFNGRYTENPNSSSNQEYSYDKADYKRTKLAFNVNYGMLFNLSKRLGLSYKIGAGIRNRDVSYSNVENAIPVPFNDDDHNLFDTKNYVENVGSDVNFNFSFDFKLVYKL